MTISKSIDVVMDGVIDNGSAEKKLPVEYKVYRIRWLVLFIFVLYSASNSMQWIQYSIIQDTVVKYYGVPEIAVYWTSMIYMLAYIPLIFPASYLLDRTNLRVAIIIGSFGNCAGAWLKVLSVRQDLFWLSFLGQTVCAFAQAFVLGIPPRLAAVWFGADQVSSACSIGVFGNQLGTALGFLVTPIIVRAQGSTDQMAEDFKFLFYLVAGFTTLLFVLIILFFKAAPATPPSAAAEQESAIDSNFLKSLKTLLMNRNYLLLLISYGMNVGVFYAISTLLNQLVLTYYVGANEDAGRIGVVIVVAGMIGSVVCGVIIDKTHRFKETAIAVYTAFFMTGYLPVGFEFASEVTYPEPEGTTSGLLNAGVQVFGILLTLLFQWMLGTIGDQWANVTMCAILVIGTVLTALIQSDLRRQAAENKGPK